MEIEESILQQEVNKLRRKTGSKQQQQQQPSQQRRPQQQQQQDQNPENYEPSPEELAFMESLEAGTSQAEEQKELFSFDAEEENCLPY